MKEHNMTKGKEVLSIKVTKVFIVLMAFAAVVMCFCGPKIVRYVMDRPSPIIQGETRFYVMLICGYILAVITFIFLYMMYALVRRIGEGDVFTSRNVVSLQNISYLVILVCIVSLILGFTCAYMCLTISAAAAFMTAIIRVVKNAFGMALEMKDELDYTV